MKILAALLTLIVALASSASSQNYESAIVLDMGYVAGPPGWTPWEGFPAIGAPLWIVGTVQSFGAPISGLAPPAGTYEATYVIEGLSCTSNMHWDNPASGTGGMGSCFEGGFLRIYVDETPDANPVDVSTYRDGELVLEASLGADFCLYTSNVAYLCPMEPTEGGSFVFSGGSWFSHVSDGNGQGYSAFYEGCFWESISEALRQLGYVGQSEGVIDIQGPISTERATWGKIKALYR